MDHFKLPKCLLTCQKTIVDGYPQVVSLQVTRRTRYTELVWLLPQTIIPTDLLV